MMGGGMMNRMHDGGIWFVNGVAAEGHILDPMLTLERDASHVIAMTNATAFHHPIHRPDSRPMIRVAARIRSRPA